MPSEKLAAVCKSPIKTEIEMGCTQQDAFAVAPNITHPSPLPRGLLLALCTGLGARRGSTESSGAPALTAVLTAASGRSNSARTNLQHCGGHGIFRKSSS